jgi:hypothetical protein
MTGAHSSVSGYEQRSIWQRQAIERFVGIAGEYRPHNWVFCWSPTLEAWRGGSTALTYFLANAYAGRQFIDGVFPTFYDAPWNASVTDLPDGYSSGAVATRETRWNQRWQITLPWLNNFATWRAGSAGDPVSGWHEVSIFSSVAGVGQAFNTGYENVEIVHSTLDPQQAGGDNDIFIKNIWDWSVDPVNKCMGIGWFSEQYRHDIVGFYQSSNTRPYSQRHRRCAEYYYNRYTTEGVGNIRTNIEYMRNRRPANFGGWS